MRYLLFAITLCASSTVRAQDAQGPTFNLQLFRPAIDSKGFFTVNASPVLDHLDFSVGLVGTYARDVLVLRQAPASFRVSDLVSAQVQAALGLFDRAELGVSLPVHILFGSRAPGYVSPDSPNRNDDLTFGAQSVGDLGLHAKVRLLQRPIGLALLASVYAPTGDARRFLGEGNVSLRPELILDKDLGRVRLALNAGALVRIDKHRFTDRGATLPTPDGGSFCFPTVNGACGTGITRALGTQLTWGLALSGAVVRERLDLIAEVYGYADVTGSDHAFPLEWLAGGKVYLAAKSYFQFGAGTGIIPGQTGSPVVRGFVGFVFEPPVRERVRAQADEPAITRPTPAPAPPEPPLTKVRVRHGSLQLFEKIYFETAKATIKPISYAILDAVAATLATNPQLDLVEIQGHADERGDDDYNLQLTQDRAQAVKQYLVDHGISADRLMASGYGETRPLCRAHDEDCWSANRRVELIILHQTGAIPGQD